MQAWTQLWTTHPSRKIPLCSITSSVTWAEAHSPDNQRIPEDAFLILLGKRMKRMKQTAKISSRVFTSSILSSSSPAHTKPQWQFNGPYTIWIASQMQVSPGITLETPSTPHYNVFLLNPSHSHQAHPKPHSFSRGGLHGPLERLERDSNIWGFMSSQVCQTCADLGTGGRSRNDWGQLCRRLLGVAEKEFAGRAEQALSCTQNGPKMHQQTEVDS